MKKPILIFTLISLLLAGIGLAIAKNPDFYSLPIPAWLTGSTEDKINNLGSIQPSYADHMLWIGIRFDELFAAGKIQKWQYARHQAIKIKETLEKAAFIDPSRKTGIKGLISANYPGLIEAIDTQNQEKFQGAFAKLYASCVNCHVKQGVFFLPLIPTTSVSPITSGSLELLDEIQKHLREEEKPK